MTRSTTSSGFSASEIYLSYIDLPHRAAIKGFRVFYAPLQGNGETMTLKVEINEDSTLQTIGTITAATDDAVNEVSKYFPFTILDVDKFQINLSYGAVATDKDQVYIRKIEIFYENTDYVE